MTILSAYNQFEGLHWETGTVRNYFDYRGVRAPHTGQPFSEALLLGITGGIVMGYFSFAYEGYDPHVVILTRNTFDPLDTLLQRLGVVQNVLQTSRPEKGLSNLLDSLEDGVPPLVWADMFSLPYNALPQEERMWAMMPVLIYGYEEVADKVWIADRARVPLTVSPAELEAARGRVKKNKYRLLTLEPPDPDKLTRAVNMGIVDCIRLYTEAPPKGARHNFGFAAYQRWADLLTKPKMRLSWMKEFPLGRKRYAGLTSAFNSVALFGKDGGADRTHYAAFLDEASVLLGKSALREAADMFRRSAQAWDALGDALLPDDVAPLKETRELMLRKHRLFLDQGNAGLEEMAQINTRLDQIQDSVGQDFPMTEAQVQAMDEALAARILAISDLERSALAILQDGMELD